jgi:hypothetical protein
MGADEQRRYGDRRTGARVGHREAPAPGHRGSSVSERGWAGPPRRERAAVRLQRHSGDPHDRAQDRGDADEGEGGEGDEGEGRYGDEGDRKNGRVHVHTLLIILALPLAGPQKRFSCPGFLRRLQHVPPR